jgi:hypothetical protein
MPREPFSGKLGITWGQSPLCVKLPPDIDAAIRGAGDGSVSARLRRWIVAGALSEGLISEEQAQPFVKGE